MQLGWTPLILVNCKFVEILNLLCNLVVSAGTLTKYCYGLRTMMQLTRPPIKSRLEKFRGVFIVVNGHKEALLAIVSFTHLRNLNISVANLLNNVKFIVY